MRKAIVIFVIFFGLLPAASQALERRRSKEKCTVQFARGKTDWHSLNFKEVFEELQKAGVLLFRGLVRKRFSDAVHRVLYRKFGIDVGGPGFVDGVDRVYGSWEAALEANHIDPSENPYAVVRRISSEEILTALQALYAAKRPLDSGKIRDDIEESQAVVEKAIGLKISSYALFFRVSTSKFKTWPAALDAAGLPIGEILSAHLTDRSPKFVLKVIRFLGQHFSDMNLIALSEKEAQIRSLTYQQFKIVISAHALGRWAKKNCGSWPAAVGKAGLPTDNLRWASRGSKNLQSRHEVVRLLKFLARNFADMNISALRQQNLRVAQLTFEEFGFAVGTNALEIAVERTIGGTWIQSLQAAGLDTSNIRAYSIGVKWSEDLLKDVLYEMSKRWADMHLNAFLRRAKQVRQLNMRLFGMPLNCYQIYQAAIALYGGWYQALDAASVPVKRTRRRRVTSDIVLMPHVTYWTENADGTSRRVVEYGESLLNPEEALLESESKSQIQSATDLLSPRNKLGGLALLAYLEDHAGLDDEAAVLGYLQSQTGDTWQPQELKDLLESMAQGLSDLE